MTTLFDQAQRYEQNRGTRPGQSLYNVLPSWVGNLVNGGLFDPYYRLTTWSEVKAWINDYCVLDETGRIIIKVILNGVVYTAEDAE